MLIPNPDLPIAITSKSDRSATTSLDGYEQSSSFAPLKSVKLSYLNRSQAEFTGLLTTLDTLGGKPGLTWDFRPHYVGKKWQVKSFGRVQYDQNIVEEWTIDLMEYPTAPVTIFTQTVVLPGYLVPIQAPTLTTEYRIRSSTLGKFPDYADQRINSKREKIGFASILTWAQVDKVDILLDRSRGVYPLVYEGKKYVCPEWSITYEGEDCAEIRLDLSSYFASSL